MDSYLLDRSLYWNAKLYSLFFDGSSEHTMVYEIAEIDIIEGEAENFEIAVSKAAPYFQAAQGYQSLALQRCIESPNHYQLVVGWNSVDDHMVTFRESDGFQKWRELASPFFKNPPKVGHVETKFSVDI